MPCSTSSRATRLRAGHLTVIDATSVQPQARKSLVALAREHDCLPVAIVLNMPESLCLARNRERPDRQFGSQVVRRQADQLRRSLRGLKREGFRHVFVLDSPEEVEAATIERVPLWVNLQHEHGPFDIIGDVHGCYDELVILLERLGYRLETSADSDGETGFSATHPEGRKAVFVGDLVDRGPGVAEVLKLVMGMVSGGVALCVAGNHESKLLRKLRGRDVQVSHGLAESLAQLELESPAFRERVAQFLDGLISHYVLDDGGLVVAHAGMKSEYQGRTSARVRDFCLYGETTGETDEFGLPVRANWAAGYRGRAMVVYGHTPVMEPAWLNSTINVDTGCVFGGKLTALRYPEKELVSVPAARVYYEPVKPLAEPGRPEEPAETGESRAANLLDIDDVLGKRIVATRAARQYHGSGGERCGGAGGDEPFCPGSPLAGVPSAHHIPPVIAPSCPVCWNIQRRCSPTSAITACPAWSAKKSTWGSRAIVVVGRDAAAIERRFGITGEGIGACYTRTGRRFFEDRALEAQFLERVGSALAEAGLWSELGTDWVVLDSELMPWSVKAQELLREQYAAVGAAARVSLTDAAALLRQTAARSIDTNENLAGVEERLDSGPTLQRRLCPLLLAGEVAGRHPVSAVPPDGQRGTGAY